MSAAFLILDDNDVFAFGVKLGDGAVEVVIEQVFGVGCEELHRLMHPVSFVAFDGEVARFGCAAAEDHGIEILTEPAGCPVVVFSNKNVADELNTFCFHQGDAAKDDFFFVELHVGDTIHEQTTGSVGAFEDGDLVAGFVELISAGETGRAGAHDGDGFTRAFRRWVWGHSTIFPTSIGNRALDIFDGDGWLD